MSVRPLAIALGLALALSALPRAAFAQHQVTAAFAITDPRGPFDINTDTGYGFTGGYLYAFDEDRVFGLGVTGLVQSYGRTGRRAPLSPTIPDLRVDVETTNNTAMIQGLVQLKAPTGAVQPYLQGTGGFGWFFTTTSLQNRFTDETILSDTNQSDGTWIWGGGGGVLIRVYEGDSRPDVDAQGRVLGQGRDPVRAYMDLGARAIRGDDVEYLTEGSLVTDQGEVDIDRRLVESEIEAVQYQIGLTVEF
ncbi:MAG: hypothetical protein ACREMK_12455 [Gemmatimonadota bacterium]